MYGWAAREAAWRGFGRILTYTGADEPGTSLNRRGLDVRRRHHGRRLAPLVKAAPKHECLDPQATMGADAEPKTPGTEGEHRHE
jgi:hypothetical protein